MFSGAKTYAGKHNKKSGKQVKRKHLDQLLATPDFCRYLFTSGPDIKPFFPPTAPPSTQVSSVCVSVNRLTCGLGAGGFGPLPRALPRWCLPAYNALCSHLIVTLTLSC
ncbi:hypothetical protein BaRGS_00021194 [Batillaria attramentaria]|uniref:Uncharacterized protein n=1 Tax=Batillaria attramentaria TaxID=370345 RepID=A0ABD0KKD0_9CAEN